ncbi:MAG: hypothetical protein AB8F74_16005 [Saprospiraceae bacterium]
MNNNYHNNRVRVGHVFLVAILLLGFSYLLSGEEKYKNKFKFLFCTQNLISNSYDHYILVENFYGTNSSNSLDLVACKHYDTCRFFQPIRSVTFLKLNKSKAYYLVKEEGETKRLKENSIVSFFYDYKHFDKTTESCPPIDSINVVDFRGNVRFVR